MTQVVQWPVELIPSLISTCANIVRAESRPPSSKWNVSRERNPQIGNQTPEIRYPKGAWATLLAGKLNCNDPTCTSAHGCFHSKDNPATKGSLHKQCDFEASGRQCLYMDAQWMLLQPPSTPHARPIHFHRISKKTDWRRKSRFDEDNHDLKRPESPLAGPSQPRKL